MTNGEIGLAIAIVVCFIISIIYDAKMKNNQKQ